MAKSWNGAGANGVTTSTTSNLFFHTGGASFYNEGTENRTELKVNHSLTISKLRVYISANAKTAANSGFFRKNGADTALTYSITGLTTGWFEDNTNTFTVAAGDRVNIRQNMSNGGSNNITYETLVYQIDSGTGEYPVQWYQSTNSLNITLFPNTTYFGQFAGLHTAVSSGAEARQRLIVRSAGTYSRLQAFVRTNTATVALTMKFRKNGADGNQSVSITSATTGHFEDSTNTDTVADGDTINISISSGAGSGNAIFTMYGVCFKGSADYYDLFTQSGNGRTRNNSTATEFFSITSSGATSTTEANKQQKVPCDFEASKFRVYIDAAPTNSTTFTMRKNGSDTSLTVSTNTLTTGWYEDASNTVQYNAGDQIAVKISAASSSTVTWYTVAIRCKITDGSGGAGGGGGGGGGRNLINVIT